MSINVQRTSSLDVSQKNPNATVYFSDGTFTANEFTDGSIRFLYDAANGMLVIRKRENGVWNDTSLKLNSNTLELGEDFSIGAAASFIETFNQAIPDEHQKALIPHITFDDDGTKFLHTAILDGIETDAIFETAVSETIDTSIGISFFTDHGRFVSSIDHEVGTIGASAKVQYSMYVGTDNSGILIKRKNLPSSDLIANTTLTVDFKSSATSSRPNYVGLNANENFFIELTSDSAFSLKTDISGNPLTTFTEQHFSILGSITENLMLDEDLNHMFDESLNPMYAIQFP